MASTFKTIHILIDNLLYCNNIKSPPILVQKLIEEETDYNITETGIEDNKLSGLIDVEQKLIVLNKFESIERKRFTTAHFMGHLFLHADKVAERDPNAIYLYRKSTYLEEKNKIEIEANYFAANLLVPALIAIKHPTLNKVDLADLFKVHRFVLNLQTLKEVEETT